MVQGRQHKMAISAATSAGFVASNSIPRCGWFRRYARYAAHPSRKGRSEPRDGLVISVKPHKDRKSTRLNSSHGYISYAVFCLKKKKNTKFIGDKSISYVNR